MHIIETFRTIDLLAIEKNIVSSTVWIADTEEHALELTKGSFLGVTASNILRGIEYRFIFAREDCTISYWGDLQSSIAAEIPDSDIAGRLSARFVPRQILELTPDFVVYDAKKPSRRAFIGILQGGEYWHIEQDQSRVIRLISAFDRLWETGLRTHLLIADEDSQVVCKFPPGLLPPDISSIIDENMREASRCLMADCPTAAIALYGRTIETLLYATYVKVKKTEPDCQWGLDALCSRLREASVELAGIKEQFNLIKRFRNKAVHGSTVFPTQEQARAIGMLAKDLIAQVARQLRAMEKIM